ncbi:radical SAM protein [Kosmotoga arenicorallina S304]|uniref:Radical SAM protein n=1 Tax=Kosmotoga arenicorallina S304 TaxID=1453497 RepID=A0A182C7J0_9BACT|nr:[FeFe] hydrogenase H-cluster radical SAM maturase HydE [Kosmotoga arenicorallina]OAA31595.1 radical SAM protein [Kosmotoga arenicorallina S304]
MDNKRFEIIKEIKEKGLEKLFAVAIRALEEIPLSKEEIVYLLTLEEGEERRLLFKLANAFRHDYMGDMVFIKGVIEFSNYCRKNCAYCGIRASNKVHRYRMSPDEIISVAINMAKLGVDTIILQSGEDPYYDLETLEHIVSTIRSTTYVPVSLSIGELPKPAYLKLKHAGASKVLLKHETINKKIFEAVHPDDDYDERIDLLDYIVSLGYVGGSGNIIGLPGQVIEDIADDILFMKRIGVKMIGLGPFVPAEGTPLQKFPHGDPELTLNTYAAIRLTMPRVFMPATTALGTIDEKKQFEAFNAGCNVIMCNFTPEKYRKDYMIYTGKAKVEFFQTAKRLKEMGFKLSVKILRELEKHEKEVMDRC